MDHLIFKLVTVTTITTVIIAVIITASLKIY